MAGVLAVAAAIPAAFAGQLLPFTLAYALMRLPLIAQWVRSAVADPAHRAFALTYAAGAIVAQVFWVAGTLLGGAARVALFVVAMTLELIAPVRAVRTTPDRVFHVRHIAERYGLFTIIVLGETVLAASAGLRESADALFAEPAILLVVASVLVIAFGLWWLYFNTLGADALGRNRAAAFAWGYGHYVVFAGIAAIGAGAQAQLDTLNGPAPATDGHGSTGALAVAVAVAVVLGRVSDPARSDAHLLLGVLACLGLGVAGWAWDGLWLMPGLAVCVLAVAAASTREAVRRPGSTSAHEAFDVG